MSTTSARPDTSYVDVAATIDEYLDRSDWRVNANANQGYSLGGLILQDRRQGHRQLLAVAGVPGRRR